MKRFAIKKQILIVALLFIITKLYSQTFTEQTSISLPGGSSGSVAWGDYDNDGDFDILMSGFAIDNSFYVKVYRNNGSNSFTEQLNILTPALPSLYYSYIKASASWVDIDNDGYLDILYNGPSASSGNVMMIYKNNGDNTFTLKTSIDYLTRENNSVDVGDYDNDGDMDILVTNSVVSKVYQNQGNFVFTEQFSAALGAYSNGVAKWGDYDNDGDLDILISGTNNNYSLVTNIYQNQGNNVFALQTGIQLTGASSGSVAWGDYNNDGFLDILVTGSYGSSVYKNNGNNTFTVQPGIVLPAVSDSKGMWGDLDNDGDLDIIISGTNSGTNISKIYINNGNNTFTAATGLTIDGVKECSVDLIDYDNDGDLDILISGNTGPSKITKVFRNDTPAVNPVPGAPTGLTSVIQGSNIILKWTPVANDNTVKKSISYNLMVGTTAGGINIVSPNSATGGLRRISGMGNSQLDTTFVLKNLKKTTYYWKVQAVDNSFKGGAFSPQSTFTYSSSYQAFGLKASQIGGKESTLTWSRGNGLNCVVFLKEANTGTALPINNTTYTASSIFKTGSQIGTSSGWYCVYKGASTSVNVTGLKVNTDYIFEVIEFDGLAGAEIYNTLTSTDNPVTFKTGSFTEVKSANLLPVNQQTTLFEQYSSVSWFDFDNDDDLDLILVGSNGSKLYRNDGNGVFFLMPLTLSSGYFVATGDYNNDGFIDFIINSNPIQLYKNNGNGTFTLQTGLPFTGTNYGSVDFGDYDNDGNLDISLCGESSIEGRITKIYRNNGDNTFTEQTSIALMGVNGTGCTAKFADYDNDGFLDLLVSGMNNSAIFVTKIYRNNGNNNFIEQAGISIPSTFGSTFAWGDYDNDGDLDLLMAKNGSNSLIYRNNGNNSFTEIASNSLIQAGAGSASWGDYDNDGDLDILLSGFTNNNTPLTKIYKNTGNDTFIEDTSCQITGTALGASAWVDFDNDGDLDVIVTGNSADASVSKIFRNDLGFVNIKPAAPTGILSTVNKSDVKFTWHPVLTDNTPYKAMTYNIRVGNSNNGGISVVSPHSSSTGLRRIVGIGNCSLDTTYFLKKLPFGTYFWSVQAIDNGLSGGAFSSEGTFSVVPVQAKNLSAKILDPNSLLLKWERGNGDRCVVFCKQTSSGSASPSNNADYIADPEFGFGGQLSNTGWYCVYNGRADSVVVTGLIYKKEYSFNIIEYMGNFGFEQYFPQVADGNPGVFSTSMFAEQTGIVLTGAGSNKVVWGDYDKDGFLDLLIPGFPTKIYHNKGDNTFTDSGIILPSVSEGSAAWGDYDNDGDLDIIISGSTVNYPPSTPVTKIYRNDGANVFTEQTSIVLTGVYYSSVAWGDYDNDGDLDILLTGATGVDPNFSPVTKIYRNNGNNTFTEQSQISLTNVFRGTAIWGDYDNDGDLDILLNGALDFQTYTNNTTKIYKNNGNNTFTAQTQLNLPGFSYSSASWGDFDNDGDLDFLMTRMGEMVIYQNMGDGTFTDYFDIGLSYQGACSAAWGDYDNDGYLDFILTNPGLDTKIYHNTKGIKVSSNYTQWFELQNDAALASAGYGFIDWFDYDNDGDIDFVFAKNGLQTKVFKNNLIMKSGAFKSNTSPASPSGLTYANSPTGVLLKWNPVKNDETPSITMNYNVKIGNSKNNYNITPSHSDAAGFRRIPGTGNGGKDTTFLIAGLPAAKYYWNVQAVDQGLKGGAWSTVDSFDVKNILAFFSADTVCQGLNTTFSNQSVAYGDVIQSYLWKFGDGSTSALQNPTHTFSTSGIQNVTLIAASATNSDTLIKQILVKAKPPVNFSATTACQGIETSIVNLTNTTGLTITSWSWDFGDGKGSISQNPVSHGYLSAGSYQITLTAAADNNCSGTVIKAINVGAYPVAPITANTPLLFCLGDSVALSVPANTNYSYNWLLNGTGLPGGSSNRFVARLSGNYSVEVLNTTGNCKTTSPVASVTAQNAPAGPLISADRILPIQFCQGDSVNLSVTNTTGYTYQWKLNGGAVGSNSSKFIAKNAGTYSMIVSNSNGCSAAAPNTINVIVNSLPTVSAVNSGGPTNFCAGGSVTLSVTPNSAYTYGWRNETGLITNANTSSFTATTSGKYQLDISNSLCTVRTTAVNVVVKDSPVNPVIDKGNYSAGMCLGETPVRLKASTVVPGYNYQWYKNGVPYNSSTSSVLEEFLQAGIYKLEANLAGCKSKQDTLNVYFEDALVKPDIYVKGPTVWYLVCSNETANKYKWYYNGTLIPGADKYMYVANQKLGKYNVSIANTKGCFTMSDTITIPKGITGIEDIDPFAGMIIYPNPTSGLFTIELKNQLFGEVAISILDQGGKEILHTKTEKTAEHFSKQIDLSTYSKGIYIIKTNINNRTDTRKVIVK